MVVAKPLFNKYFLDKNKELNLKKTLHTFKFDVAYSVDYLTEKKEVLSVYKPTKNELLLQFFQVLQI